MVLVNLAGIMERADESLLPGVYKKVGVALRTDPTGLGSLILFRSIVQSSCYPLAAYLSVHHNRAHVIALGAFLWAAATFLVAISTTFFSVSRGLNGIGLAIVTPAIQSLVADSTNKSNRGIAFGWLQLTGNFGSIIGGLCSVLIASTSFMGIPGWRITFHLVGLISVIVGILVYLFAKDTRCSDGKSRAKDQKPHKAFCFVIFAYVVRTIGFSHGLTVFLMTLFTIAGSLGGLFGGWMGDTLVKRLPNSGRIILSQISSGSVIPIAAVLLLVLPDDPSTGFMHGLVLVIMGLCISWNAPTTNKKISNLQFTRLLCLTKKCRHLIIIVKTSSSEIVPERSRTSIYALDRSFESILASFAPPVVGLLAQHVHGYKPVPKGASNSLEVETDRENAASLAKALYTAIGIPMTICCFIYSFLYCTYPRDRERVRIDALIESEMQKLEKDNAPSLKKNSQRHFSESKELNEKEVTDIDIEYGGEESTDIDDNDKKSLLPHQVTFSNLQH
ncbi:MFS domain-containing protein [Citrus sinensis]|uniref:MFS domain-containing protein n=1 Tax=Citrus sinensis TaxID=2711 RepID=A0ACB8JLP2_CITSI|nr:MFS domain-containing protein [Citrus sinensis]